MTLAPNTDEQTKLYIKYAFGFGVIAGIAAYILYQKIAGR